MATLFSSLLEHIELKTGQRRAVNKMQSQSFASGAQVCTPIRDGDIQNKQGPHSEHIWNFVQSYILTEDSHLCDCVTGYFQHTQIFQT